MADKLMYMNITNADSQNYSFCRLQLVVKKFGHITLFTKQSKFSKVPKVVKQRIEKRYNKTLGDGEIHSIMFPPSLVNAIQ